LLAIALCLAASGCGYHTAGKAVLLPTDVRTIAIPGFLNQTKTYRIEQVLTGAVVHEFTSRTHYHLMNQTGDADAILRGTVTNAVFTPLTYDSQTGRVSSGMVMLTMSVSLLDRQGKVLFSNPNYIFRDQYQISSQISSFFEEESPALDRVSRDFARTLVSNILEAF
jgi:outer membrane lipopolysaccharide assembly protein LptE/RlpB